MAVFDLSWGALTAEGRCVGFTCREAVSKLFELDVYVVVQEELELDVEGLLLTRASLKVDFNESLLDLAEPPMTFAGTVTAIELLRMEKARSLYRVRLSPQMWLLTQTFHSRIWTGKSLKEIATEVLEESGLASGEDFELRLTSEPPSEEHVCQYKESNFAFLSRWFEREGWYYFFEHEDGKDKLVVVDNKAAHSSLRLLPVRYVPQSGADGSAADAFDNVAERARLLPASVRVTDYDYSKPSVNVKGHAKVSPHGVGEIVTYGYRFFSPGDGDRLANIRAEELRASEDVLRATGAATNVRAGYLFDLVEHPRFELNRTFLVTEAVHHGYQPSLSAAWGKLVPKLKGEQVYATETKFISSDLQFRAPATTPWPGIDGFENAIVDGGGSGPYAQIDADGRYKTKFKFDEGTLKDGKATTWVRMAQPHGGSVEGFHLPLRKGTEVICSFLSGDPDRPIIVGVVPTAITPSPVVASNHTQNIIQTGSKNWVTCEDQQGNEWISIYTPGGGLDVNLYLGPPRPEGGLGLTAQSSPPTVESGPNKTEMGPYCVQLRTNASGEVYAGGNINVNAGASVQIEAAGGEFHWFCQGNWYRDVGGNAFETYTKTLTQRVHLAADYFYENTLDVTITGPTTIKELQTTKTTVTGAATHDYNENLYQRVAGNSLEEMKALHKETITKGHQSTIIGNEEIEIGGAATYDITPFSKVDVAGNKTETVTPGFTWEAKDVTLTIAGAYEKGAPKWFKKVTNHQVERVFGVKVGYVHAFHLDMGMAIKTQQSNTLMFELNVNKLSFSALVGQAAGGEFSAVGYKDALCGIKFDAAPLWVKMGLIHADLQGVCVE
jgi:type VI secretion system secreted protein VgrG